MDALTKVLIVYVYSTCYAIIIFSRAASEFPSPGKAV